LQQLRPNREFVPLSVSALARSRADWLYGINMTRAYTLQGRKVGFDGLLSVGRVQTPVLGLVVKRDREIEAFVAKPYYQVRAHLETQTGEKQSFTALWQPSEACQPHMDDEGRVLNKRLAENVVSRITDQPATVDAVNKKHKRQAAPLPYNLSALQIDAAKRYGMNAKRVLDTCQALYERHKLVTYPRSDCRHLPAEQHQRGSAVCKAIANNCDALREACGDADLQRKSKAWNDKKVTDHHAIIPTEKSVAGSSLSNDEKRLYELIARQYLIQFYPPFEYQDTRVDITIAGGHFIAKAGQVLAPGWKALFPAKKNTAHSEKQTDQPSQGTDHQDDTEATNTTLPPLKKGDALHCLKGELLEKETQPPKPFTDATLLSAMTGIARFVKDPTILKVLKETDGLGTEATRAGIIELLFKRDFLQRQGKAIHATATGKGLVDALPESATQPDMTAHWETQLNAISQKAASYQGFMDPLTQSLHQFIRESQASLPVNLQGLKASKAPFKARAKKGRKSTSQRATTGARKTGAAKKAGSTTKKSTTVKKASATKKRSGSTGKRRQQSAS